MKTRTHTTSSTISTIAIMTIPTKACHKTSMIIPHDNDYYHYHDIYHCAPNDDDDDNVRTNVIYDDDK